MSGTRLLLQIVREYIVSPYSSKREADIAWEALDQIEAALRRIADTPAPSSTWSVVAVHEGMVAIAREALGA